MCDVDKTVARPASRGVPIGFIRQLPQRACDERGNGHYYSRARESGNGVRTGRGKGVER